MRTIDTAPHTLARTELPPAFPELVRCARSYLRAEAALQLQRQTMADLPPAMQTQLERMLLTHCLETRIAMCRALATCEQLLDTTAAPV